MANLKKHGARRARNPEYLLRGILKCRCGAAMSTASTRRGDVVYRYYRCGTREKQGASGCGAGQVSAEAIERFVVERIRDTSIGGALGEQVKESLDHQLKERRAHLEAQRQRLPGRIAALANEGARLTEKLVTMTDAGARLLEGRVEKIGADLAEAEARLRAVESGLARLQKFELEADWVTKTLDSFDAVWESMTIENRRRLIQALIREVKTDESTGKVTVALAALQLPEIDIGIATSVRSKQPHAPRHRDAMQPVQMETSRLAKPKEKAPPPRIHPVPLRTILPPAL